MEPVGPWGCSRRCAGGANFLRFVLWEDLRTFGFKEKGVRVCSVCAPFAQLVDRPTNGFVLIVVLWMLALFAVMVIALTNTVRLDVQAKANLLHQAQAEALADGILLAVVAKLMEQLAGGPGSPPIGRVVQCQLDGNAVAVSVVDVAGLIDLNAAPVELLARVITGVGVAADQAAELAAAIGDFRDYDDEPLPRGAEVKEYRAAGMPFGPKNAPFETVEELDQVLGMKPKILVRLRELVTVHSRAPGLDVALAPDAVVMALAGPGFGAIERARARLAEQFAAGGGGRSRTQMVSVSVTGSLGGHFQRRATVEASAAHPLGFAIRAWGASSPQDYDLPTQTMPECTSSVL